MPSEGYDHPRAVIRRRGAKSAFALSHLDVSSHVPFGADAQEAAALGDQDAYDRDGERIWFVRLS